MGQQHTHAHTHKNRRRRVDESMCDCNSGNFWASARVLRSNWSSVARTTQKNHSTCRFKAPLMTPMRAIIVCGPQRGDGQQSNRSENTYPPFRAEKSTRPRTLRRRGFFCWAMPGGGTGASALFSPWRGCGAAGSNAHGWRPGGARRESRASLRRHQCLCVTG